MPPFPWCLACQLVPTPPLVLHYPIRVPPVVWSVQCVNVCVHVYLFTHVCLCLRVSQCCSTLTVSHRPVTHIIAHHGFIILPLTVAVPNQVCVCVCVCVGELVCTVLQPALIHVRI